MKSPCCCTTDYSRTTTTNDQEVGSCSAPSAGGTASTLVGPDSFTNTVARAAVTIGSAVTAAATAASAAAGSCSATAAG